MDIKKIIVDQITQDVLGAFVNPMVRDQDIVIAAARKWASDTYDYIESMKSIKAA
jgi:hypothetical protein